MIEHVTLQFCLYLSQIIMSSSSLFLFLFLFLCFIYTSSLFKKKKKRKRKTKALLTMVLKNNLKKIKNFFFFNLENMFGKLLIENKLFFL